MSPRRIKEKRMLYLLCPMPGCTFSYPRHICGAPNYAALERHYKACHGEEATR